MQPTTPTGSRTTSELPTVSSHSTCSSTSGIDMNDMVGRPAWIIVESGIGMPTSRAISAASSSERAAMAAPIARHASARSTSGVCDHVSKPARAASTARSTSSAVPSGTRPMTSSVVQYPTPAPVALLRSPLGNPAHHLLGARVPPLDRPPPRRLHPLAADEELVADDRLGVVAELN